MAPSSCGSRLALAGFGAIALTVAVSPTAALPREPSKRELRAVDVARMHAETTRSATYAEIRFKGSYARSLGRGELRSARTTITLVPTTGRRTVLTDRGSSRRPRERRRGTRGRFDLVRDGRVLRVLAERLRAPTRRVIVKTSGPRGAGSGAVASQDVEPEDFDRLADEARLIDSDERADFARERWGERLEKNEKELEAADREADQTIDAIHRAQRDVVEGKTSGQIREAIERRERFKAKLERLNERRRVLRSNIRILRRWLTNLARFNVGPNLRQCSDGGDNRDPEDAIADHPDDPGCVDPADNDEKDQQIPVTCPSPGGSVSSFAAINTPLANRFESIVLRRAGTGALVLESPVTGPSGGPSPLPVDVCGPGFEETFRYVTYEDTPPPGVRQPPPGEHGISVFVEVQNPPDSGAPGGGNASLGLAVGTGPR